MSGLDPEGMRSLLLEEGPPRELFRGIQAHHTAPYLTRGVFGELVFTDIAVCFVPRAAYRDVWRMFRRPMLGITFSYLPGALALALLFGLAGYSVSERGFYLGLLIGAAASVFVTTLVIAAINRKYSFEKAVSYMKNKLPALEKKPVEQENVSLIFWRDKIEDLPYDREGETLKIVGPGGVPIFSFDVPLKEYERRESDIRAYASSGGT